MMTHGLNHPEVMFIATYMYTCIDLFLYNRFCRQPSISFHLSAPLYLSFMLSVVLGEIVIDERCQSLLQ